MERENSFNKYILAFNELETEEKQEELIKNLKELFYYLRELTNIEYPIYEEYTNDDEFLSVAFSYLITIKELTAIAFNELNNEVY